MPAWRDWTRLRERPTRPDLCISAHIHLPLELWIHVADGLNIVDTRALASTCRKLRHLLQSRVYRECRLKVNQLSWWQQQQDRFLWPLKVHAITDKPFRDRVQFFASASTASLVHVVQLESGNNLKVKLVGPPLCFLYNLLPKFSNLTTLRFRNLHLDGRGLSALKRSQSLSSLCFRGCTTSVCMDLSALRLVQFELTLSDFSQAITLNSDHIEEIACDDIHLRNLVPTAALSRLRILRISKSQPWAHPTFRTPDFLQRHGCLALETLLIHFSSMTVLANTPVDFDLPLKLKCYRGPDAYLPHFVRNGSLLEDVTLWGRRRNHPLGGRFICQSLSQLHRLAPGLRRLELHLNLSRELDHINLAISAFNCLQELYLNSFLLAHNPQEAIHIIAALPLPFTLTSCIARFGTYSHVSTYPHECGLDYNRINGLMERHPNLRYTRIIFVNSVVQANPLFKWDYVCVRGADGMYHSRRSAGKPVEVDIRAWDILWPSRAE